MGTCLVNKARQGQAIVEFALIIPFLLLLTMGTLHLGRLIYYKIALQSAAREGVYFLSYNHDDDGNCDVNDICFQGTIEAVQAEANNMGVTIDPANIQIQGVMVSGETIQVTVLHTLDLMIYSLFNGPVTLSSQARMIMQ